jgi:transmembrane sensor
MQKQVLQQTQFSQEENAIAANREQLQQLFPLPDFAQTTAVKKPSKIKHHAKKAAPLLAIIFALVWLDPAYRTESVATVIGEQKTLTLADNSILTLDTNTKLQISWHLRSRQVALETGRAMFTVTPNQHRPFYVEADATQIKVVGTVFDVKREGEKVTVTVLQGKVQVQGRDPSGAPQQKTYLTKNQQAISHAGEISPSQKVDSVTKTAWKDGKIIFERTPLVEALAEMQRYKNAPIILTDTQLGQLKVSGTFNTKSTDEMLKLLPNILPVKVSHASNGAVYVSEK